MIDFEGIVQSESMVSAINEMPKKGGRVNRVVLWTYLDKIAEKHITGVYARENRNHFVGYVEGVLMYKMDVN